MTKLGLDEENDMQRRLNVCFVRVDAIIRTRIVRIGTRRKLPTATWNGWEQLPSVGAFVASYLDSVEICN